MAEKKSFKSGRGAKFLISLGVVLVIILSITAIYYRRYFAPNVTGKESYLYIRTGSDLNQVVQNIQQHGILKDTGTFIRAAQNMGYRKVRPGKYRLEEGMGNRKLVNMLKAGRQETVKLRFQNIRLKEEFAGFVSKQIEADSLSIINLLNSSAFVEKYGFNTDNVYAMFIPNSYELYWNTPADKFFVRMYDEYQKFWKPARTAKARSMGFTPAQVITLAAIVDEEALHNDEMPAIAGLYMNRYKKGIKLEADPTVIFAGHDFTVHRVLNKNLRVESPYNTYLHTGLPPGPIMMPSISAIDAVLNYQHHNYLYMCAKDDFSGYHNFASTMAEHLVNARKYQQALNNRNIRN